MKDLKKERAVLASRSPRRQELLTNLGLKFDVCPADLEEEVDSYTSFGDLVIQIAKQKAEHIAKVYPDRLIIASDTIVVVDKQVLNKPKNHDEAYYMLNLLSDRTHQVYTALYLIDGLSGKHITDYSVTDVLFADLNDEEINRYIATNEPFDKAGGYGIQGTGSRLVEKINGCFYSVMGFPVALFAKRIKELGYFL